MQRKRYTNADFQWVTWTAKDIERVADEIVTEQKERYAAIRAIPAAERTFENTVYALEASGYGLSDQINKIAILKETSPEKAVREGAGRVMDSLHKRLVDIEFDPRMYQVIKEYDKKRQKLAGPEKLLYRDMKRGYERMGFDLPKAKQARLKANIKQLGKLGIAFDKNLNEYKDQIVVSEQELEGLPETYKQGLGRTKEGKYIVTLAYPEVFPYLAGAHNEARRKELAEKMLRKGGATNVTLLKQMIKLRAENAKLLGFTTHFDYQTELRMAKSATNVERFLADLERRTRKQGEKNRAMLLDFKRERSGNKRATLEHYDIGYLFKQMRKEKFNIDGDAVREYFPFEHVKQATLDSYAELLGISFIRREDITLWHEDVQFYDVHDAKSKEYLSSFALDLYPREGKYGHVCASELVFGRQEGERYIAPLAAMLTNFPKPTKANPSLMSHGEVETFFHEFGHIMHFTLTKARYASQAGFNTAMDFVEAPSQMLENWVWDEKMLARLSKHYKTGKPLPLDLAKRMIGAKLLGEAWSVRGQIVLATLDLILHTKGARDPNALYAQLEKKLLGVPLPSSQRFLAGFGHLAHGYDAGYYVYLWSRVYAEDMFTRFERAGVLNKKVGHDYRSWILEKGSSMEEADLLKGFLGRKPNNKAFLRSIGVR